MEVIRHSGGSAGDVLPFFGLARSLQNRGHEVMVVTDQQFAETARGIDVPFVPVGNPAKSARARANPSLWSPRRGLQIVMNQLLPDPLRSYRVLAALVGENTVVIGHPFSFAARLLQERDNARCATAVLSPCLLRSNHRVPAMYGQRKLSKMATPLKSLMWYLADRWLIGPAVLPRLNRARRALDMEPLSRPFDGWIFSPTLVIGLFPEWFAPPQPDWPKQLCQTGFPGFHATGLLSPQVQLFLDRGEPPIVFTPGSNPADSEHYFTVAAAACREVGKRAIFPGATDQSHAPDDHILQLPFTPLDKVLPHCAAIVHHGGVGTTGAALSAGLPQIIRPCGFDQFDHAARIEELGVGVCLPRKDFAPYTLVTAIKTVLKDQQMAHRCQQRVHQIEEQQPLAKSCALIEEFY